MAGATNGLALGFRADANVRVFKFTAMVQSTANPSTQGQQFAALPAAANAAGVLGVTVEHFVEPNYFVPQGTNPTTVTGAPPTLYNLQNRGLTLQVNGVARCIAASPINQGQLVNIADNYGRVKAVSEAAGTTVYPVGMALHNVTAANDVVQVELNFAQTKV
ncbi:MAG TPA: hypothetical protein VGZ29_13700 [Terriglobia bacterium]|nr:hypothetical protein [Terriglobia bacterium]